MNFNELDDILKNAKPKTSNASTWDEVIGKYSGKKNAGYGEINDSGNFKSNRYKDIIKDKNVYQPRNIPSAIDIKKDVKAPNTAPDKKRKTYDEVVASRPAFFNLLDKIWDNPVMNTLAQGISQAMTPEGQDSPIEYNKNNMLNTDSTIGKAATWGLNQAGRMSGAVLMGQGLNGLNTLNAFDDIASETVRRGLAKTGIQGKAIPILQRGLTGALEGASSNAYEDYIAGKDAKEIASSALQGGIFGGAIGGTIGGVDVAKSQMKLPQLDSTDFRGEINPKARIAKESKYKGSYNVKNIPLEKAYKDYDDAVKTIQDYWGHWKLDEVEIRMGAEELGIDLDGIINRIDSAEKNGVDLRGIAEEGRFQRTVGVNDRIPYLERKKFEPKPNIPSVPEFDNSFEGFLKRSEIPEHIKKKVEGPKLPEVPKNNIEAEIRGTDLNAKNEAAFSTANDSFNLDLAKGTEFEGMSVRQLNSLNAKLDREYNDLINKDMEYKAEELLPRMKAVKEILGIENINDDISKWKDKSMISYQRETFDRNLEDMIGKEEAQKYINTYSQPLKEAEANRTRYLNETRNKVKEFGIKAGSLESELVQKFGEGEISLAEVQSSTKNWKNVVQTADYLRKYYDETLDMINEVLERNGYKPVAKRPNYFPHMGELEGILEKMGFKNETLPTEISGRTANFKPNKTFFANALHRRGDKTVYDAIRGFDNYAEAASKQIYLTDSIHRLRGLENEIRTIAKDSNHLSNFVSYLNQYTNYIAGKKHDLDRGGEALAGRGVYKVLNYVKRQVGSNMVGANISSNLTNFIPITQSLATTSKPAAARGLAETINDLLTHNDDFINKSDFLTRRFGSDKLAKTGWEKVGDSISGLFGGIDRFTSTFIVRSKFNELISKGFSETAALRGADDYAARLMTDKSLGQLPVMFNSKTIGAFTQFQSEVNNQVSFLMKDLKGLKKSGEISNGLISAVTQISIYSWIYNNIFEQLTGRRPAIDPIEVILDVKDDEKTGFQKVEEVVTSISDNLPFTSLITGGRIPIEEPIKGLINIGKGAYDMAQGGGANTLIDGLTTTATYVGPTGGSQILKTSKGLSALNNNGVYTGPLNVDKSKLKYAIDPNTANKLRGLLFGPSAFPETQEYYDKNRRPLSVKQTEEYEKILERGLTPIEAYNTLIKAREERAKK